MNVYGSALIQKKTPCPKKFLVIWLFTNQDLSSVAPYFEYILPNHFFFFSYGERIDRVETRITSTLRDQLGTAKNANEMFRIFSRFNALFVRPRIRGAIREYQKLLIGLVKEDIETLHDKFKVQYPHSKASKMSKVRDLPPVSGSIIWAKEVNLYTSLHTLNNL